MYIVIYHGKFGLITWQSKSYWDKQFEDSYYYEFDNTEKDALYIRFIGLEITIIK